jgi:hypothetical protein
LSQEGVKEKSKMMEGSGQKEAIESCRGSPGDWVMARQYYREQTEEVQVVNTV